ncbi:MAG: STAS domain-containing protein [Acidobacteria bacterium]|nr:STAS domain-containing protein [Acidobacteriota bacterium]
MQEAPPSGLKVSTRSSGDVHVIDAEGRVTLGPGATALRRALDGAAGKHPKTLLNLGQVSYIDSAGLGELVGGFTAIRNRGGQLRLVRPTRRVKELLQITGLVKVFDIYDEEAAAVRSFG